MIAKSAHQLASARQNCPLVADLRLTLRIADGTGKWVCFRFTLGTFAV